MADTDIYSKAVFYSKGSSGAGAFVGYDNENRVVRYTFTTPPDGASKFSFLKDGITVGISINSGEILRFYVTDDPTSHVNAGVNSEYHGTVTVSGSGSKTLEGEANIILLPNKEYYLFIFPGFTTDGGYSWNYPNYITLNLSGGAGITYIKQGSEIKTYQAYVKRGSDWKLCLPYKKKDDSWNLLT